MTATLHKASLLEGISGHERQVDILTAWLVGILIALTYVGYAVAGATAAIVGLESVETSYPYRIAQVALSLILFMLAIGRRELKLGSVIAVFLALYGIRLGYDANYQNMPDIDRTSQLLLAGIVLPLLGLSGGARHVDERRIAISIMIIGTMGCLLILSTSYFGDVLLTLQTTETGRLGFETLNPITVGYTGLFTALASYSLWRLSGFRMRILILLPVIGIGLVTVVAASSRGPLVGGALGLLVLSAVHRKTLLTLLLVGIVAYLLFIYQSQDLSIFSRFESIGTDESSLIRLYVQQASIELMLEHPLFGHAYVETIYSYSYPHNLLIESGLALGLFGLALMLFMQIRLVLQSIWAMSKGYRLIPLIALCGFANAWLSSAIWGAADFFLAAHLLMQLRRQSLADDEREASHA